MILSKIETVKKLVSKRKEEFSELYNQMRELEESTR